MKKRSVFCVLFIICVFTISISTNAAKKGYTGAAALLISSVPTSNNDVSVMKKIIDKHAVDPTVTVVKKYDSDNRKDNTDEVKWYEWIRSTYKYTNARSVSYFYYSGHTSYSRGNPDGCTLNGFRGDYISYALLLTMLDKNVKGKLVIIMDSCGSAQFIKWLGKSKIKNKNRFYIITSCNVNEFSNVKENKNGSSNGFFTLDIQDAMSKKGNSVKCDKSIGYKKPDRRITLSELYNHVKSGHKFGYIFNYSYQKPQKYGNVNDVIFVA